ncbi:MAG: 2-hydroxyacid dehydrogenase [Sagittula sp.]|uniref:2-hydroxyacid dehydrogenase n=1 Tax=Sagittula sp. TaxID=2038081 RepID=UPI004057D701
MIRVFRALIGKSEPDSGRVLSDYFFPESLSVQYHEVLIADLDHLACAPVGTLPAETEVLLFRRGRIDAALMDRLPALRVVQRLGSGTGDIDLAEAKRRGVAVSCIARPSLATVAEHCLMLILALNRRLLTCDAAVRSGGAAAGAPGDVAYNWPGIDAIEPIWGKTLGILGMGEVGRLLADRARAFGMTVIYADQTPLPEADGQRIGARNVPLTELYEASDILSIHIPGSPDNRAAVGRTEIARMKPSALIVNTSRGSVLDEAAVYDALAEGRLAGAALDVHTAEPRPADDLSRLANVVLTPHVAAGSRLTVLKDFAMICDNLRAFGAGRPLPHGVVTA